MEKDLETIDNRVFTGISRTLQRFWMNPLFYFTPGDIAASLFYDMMAGTPEALTFQDTNYGIKSPLVHLNYPTNFNYNDEKLRQGYSQEEFLTSLDFSKILGHIPARRGTYSLVVLNPKFLRRMRFQFREPKDFFNHATNGSLNLALNRKEIDSKGFESEVLYAFEINYFHPWQKDAPDALKIAAQTNEKLRLAQHHARGNLRPVHLIFQATGERDGESNEASAADTLKEYTINGMASHYGEKTCQIPNNVLNLFIRNHLTKQTKKSGSLIHYLRPDTGWASALIEKIHSILPKNKKMQQAA